MDQVNPDHAHQRNSSKTPPGAGQAKPARSRRKNNEADDDPSKRRCVSTACIACRYAISKKSNCLLLLDLLADVYRTNSKRKSKCDGNTPACAACSQVYGTECIYDPNSDHRRKGVYKNDIDNLKTRNTTLQTIIQAILNYEEENAFELVREIRTCESLDAVAEKIAAKDRGADYEDDEDYDVSPVPNGASTAPTFETQLYGKMGDLRLDEGSVRYIGGTSNLIHISLDDGDDEADEYPQHDVSGASNAVGAEISRANGCRILSLLGRELRTIRSSFFICLICTSHGIIPSSRLYRRACSGGTLDLESLHQTPNERRITVHLYLSMPCWPLAATSHLIAELGRIQTIQGQLEIISSEKPSDSSWRTMSTSGRV